MPVKFSKKPITLISVILSIAVGVCLSGLVLLNLTSFYENDTARQVILFLIVMTVISSFVFFANKAFILPYLDYFKKWETWVFIGLMVIILTISMSISAEHYWEMPIIHKVKICFDAEENAGNLIIDDMVDPNTNRQYSLRSFGLSRYPFTINSGTCIDGEFVNLVRRSPRWWIVPRVKLIIKSTPPDGRFFVSINDVPSVVYFDQDAEERFNAEVIINEGFEKGNQIRIPWRKAWFFALKAGGVLLSGFYLSVLFFGLSERIISYRKDELLKGLET